MDDKGIDRGKKEVVACMIDRSVVYSLINVEREKEYGWWSIGSG